MTTVTFRNGTVFDGRRYVGAGAVLVAAGTRLGPHHVAALASVGAARVRVGTRPRVAVVTTGDELVPPEAAVLPHLIRQSNGPALAAMLALRGVAGVEPRHVRDTPEALRDALLDREELVGSEITDVLEGAAAARTIDLTDGAVRSVR